MSDNISLCKEGCGVMTHTVLNENLIPVCGKCRKNKPQLRLPCGHFEWQTEHEAECLRPAPKCGPIKGTDAIVLCTSLDCLVCRKPKEVPMGCSEWERIGRKWGYWQYFEDKINQGKK
jgi:hypothetical protein